MSTPIPGPTSSTEQPSPFGSSARRDSTILCAMPSSLRKCWPNRFFALTFIQTANLSILSVKPRKNFTHSESYTGHRNSSQSFLPEHALRSMMLAAASITALALRALWGHTCMQRMHEMHLSLSVCDGSLASMAPTGHFAAHIPHLMHAEVALGIIPAFAAFL